MQFDPKIISRFRNEVNGNSEFILYKYRNHEKKNLWGCVCACMDWITVSAQNISTFKNNLNSIGIDTYSKNVFSYISAVDVIIESVNQLHRVLVNKCTIPFKGETDVFGVIEGYFDDLEYFKHLRSVFGAHPVNLNKNNIKWFASWPFDDYSGANDLSVFLYPNNPSLEMKKIGLEINKVTRMGEKYYAYLNVLENRVKELYKEFCMFKASVEIQKDENELIQIDILLRESKARLDSDYINFTLQDLKVCFSSYHKLQHLRNDFEGFVLECRKLLDEIFILLQTMDFDRLSTENLRYDYVLDGEYVDEISYDLGKFYSDRCGPMYHHHYQVLRNYFIDIVDLNLANGYDEVFFLIKYSTYSLRRQ